ncbi:hypothetical protein ACOMHN_037102 [Nucella lapillus]
MKATSGNPGQAVAEFPLVVKHCGGLIYRPQRQMAPQIQTLDCQGRGDYSVERTTATSGNLGQAVAEFPLVVKHCGGLIYRPQRQMAPQVQTLDCQGREDYSVESTTGYRPQPETGNQFGSRGETIEFLY